MLARLITIDGPWFRCVSLARDPLSAEGARLMGGRFNRPGVPTLYLASAPTLAVAEHLQLGDLYGVARFPPRLLVTVEVRLTAVLDAGDPNTLKALGLSPSVLLDSWRDTLEPATWAVGAAARAQGIEAIRFTSRTEPRETNLAVFVETLRSTSTLAVVGLGVSKD